MKRGRDKRKEDEGERREETQAKRKMKGCRIEKKKRRKRRGEEM